MIKKKRCGGGGGGRGSGRRVSLADYERDADDKTLDSRELLFRQNERDIERINERV